jgi:preprotein translocase subunit SecA
LLKKQLQEGDANYQMIQIQENPKNGKNLIINQETGLFSDATYFIHLNVCKNAKCNCGIIKLIVSKQEELLEDKIEYVIPMDVHNKTIKSTSDKDFKSIENNKDAVRNFFLENLTREDWHLLSVEYFEMKFDIIEQVNVNEIDYEFSREHIEDEALMVFYSDIFEASFFQLELENESYEISDYYCKNPQCNCTDVYLEIFKIKRIRGRKNTSNSLGEIKYNYKTFETTIEGKYQKEKELVFNKLKEKYENLQHIFERRHKIVKELFKKVIIKFEKEQIESAKYKNRGRNELCPCGSGKKFKNCCLNK